MMACGGPGIGSDQLDSIHALAAAAHGSGGCAGAAVVAGSTEKVGKGPGVD